MRKTVQVLMVALLSIVLSYSCNLVMPERVEISGSPTLDVSAGSVSIDITKYVDLETMLTDSLSGAFSDPGDSFASNEVPGAVGEPTVYVINARKQLFTQPLADIFDMDTGLGGLTQTIEPMSFIVPNFTFTQTYIKNLGDNSLGDLGLPELTAVPLLELGSGSLPVTVPESGTILINDFSALVLETGNLLLDVTKTGASAGLDLQISSAVLLDAGNATVAEAGNTPLAIDDVGTLIFDLAGRTLPGELKFQLEVSMSGGDGQTLFDLALDARLENLAVLRAEGVEISELFEGNEPVALTKPTDLVSATIGSGELLITLTPPDSFSGTLTDFNASLSIGSVIDRPATKISDTLYRIDLDEIVLSSFEDGSLVYSIQVTASDATIDFPAAFTVGTELVVTEYSHLVLAAADLDFSYSEPFPISQDIIDAVQSATFSDARLVFNLTNGLPSDLEINFNSEVLTGGTPDSLIFPGGSSTTDSQSMTLLAHSANSINFSTDLVEEGLGKAIDINLGISLTGFSGGQLSLTGVVPGQEYLFSGNFELVLDLASVTLGDVNHTGTFPESGGDPLDFSALGDFLPPGVNLNEDPVDGIRSWLVVSSGMDLAIEVVVLGKYIDPELGTLYIDILEPGLVQVLESEFLDPATYALDNSKMLTAGRLEIFLAQLVNQRVSGLELAYHLGFSESIVELDTAEDQGRLDVLMQLEIPLQLDVTTVGGVYWMPEDDLGQPMITITDDLLGRTVVGDSEELEQVFDFLESASLSYTLANTVISGDLGYPEVVIYQGAANYDDATFKKRIPLGGASSIELEWQDIEYIRNNLFMPTVELFLPEGLININPKGELSLGISLRLETDIVHEFSFGKDDSNDL